MNKEIKNYIFSDIYEVPEEYLKKTAICFEKKKYSYDELSKSVDFFANLLLKMGVKKDDHVAILSMNSFNWIASFYAVIKIGAVAVLINYISRHDDIVKVINFTDCKYLLYGKYIAFEKNEKEFDKILSDTNIDKNHTLSIKHSDLEPKEFLNNNIEKIDNVYNRNDDSKRTSFIIFTTGTTSEPKAVELSQFGILNHIYHNLYELNEIASDKFMCLLPMFHCFGLLVVNAYLSFQRIIYINEMSNPMGVYKDFIHAKCGDIASIGYIYDKIARVPGFCLHRKIICKTCNNRRRFYFRKRIRFFRTKIWKGQILKWLWTNRMFTINIICIS